MSLSAYKKKRNFGKTPEPAGQPGEDISTQESKKRSRSWQEGEMQAGGTPKGTLRFVVQKHAASRLHYDFRLELDGVLKSWAVPKGPSMDPAVKRLAMEVEDHPIEYRTFEGTIPEGNYGAGEVIVWDEGTYRLAEATDPKEEAELLRRGFQNGNLKFVLEGQKLKGGFALIRTGRAGKNSWLLNKKKDEYATTEAILAEGKSVRSEATIAESSPRGQLAGRRRGAESRSQAGEEGTEDTEGPPKSVPRRGPQGQRPQRGGQRKARVQTAGRAKKAAKPHKSALPSRGRSKKTR